MSGEWRLSTWGEEISLEYGKALRGYDEAKGPYRVFGSNGPIGWTAEPLAKGPGVILGRKGAYRGVQYSPDPFFVIDTAYYVVPKTDLDMRWLYYAIKHYKLGEVDDGSPIPSTTRAAVYMLDLDVPPMDEQRAIAHILGTLDDKIELNLQMNETLEEMARALFRSWFVDFDPVRARSEGRDLELPKSVAALFPDRFVNSELGEIPAGWDVADVHTIADVIYGAPFKSTLFNDKSHGRPLLRIRDLSTNDPKAFTTEEHSRGHLVQPGDLVVGMDGEFRARLWRGPEAWLNQRVCCFKPRQPFPRAYVHYSIERPLGFFEGAKTGTTVIHLGKADIDTFRVVRPPDEIVVAFGRVAEPLEMKMVLAAQESRALAKTRDALLPKLMSGEVRTTEG